VGAPYIWTIVRCVLSLDQLLQQRFRISFVAERRCWVGVKTLNSGLLIDSDIASSDETHSVAAAFALRVLYPIVTCA